MDALYTIALIAVIVLSIFVLLKIIAAPVKLAFKLLINAASGFLLLIVANIISGFFNFSITINLINCIVAGIFGIPGVALLILIKLMI